MDFDMTLLTRMTAALNIYDAVTAGDRAGKMAEWAKANPEAARIYADAMEASLGDGD